MLIRVHAASANSRERSRMRANPFFMRLMAWGVQRPKDTILGADMAGRVEAVGSNVKQFLPGDEVLGVLSRYGGRTLNIFGCAPG